MPERGFKMSEVAGDTKVVTGSGIGKGLVEGDTEEVKMGDEGLIAGIKVWEGHLSAAVVKAIVENKMGKELGAIGELLSEMDDEDRSELGDMDYAVGAQKVSEEDGDILLLPAGVQMLRKLVAPIVKIGAKLKALREAQVELRRSAEGADAMREAQGVMRSERDGLLAGMEVATARVEKGEAEIVGLKSDLADLVKK